MLDKLFNTTKKIFIKEFDVTELKPYVNSESFTESDCKKILLYTHDAQYYNKDRFNKQFYRYLNTLLRGSYIAGLQEGMMEDSDKIKGEIQNFNNFIKEL